MTSSAPNFRWAEAISITGCAGATIVEASGDQPRKLICYSFRAELLEAVPDPDLIRETLVPTGEIVEVQHKFREPMEPDMTITVALRPDGRWTLLVWECGD